jgi:hypothetical protein
MPWLCVPEDYRHKGVSEFLLTVVTEVCANASQFVVDDSPPLSSEPIAEALHEDADEGDEESSDEGPVAMLEENPIRLYVIAVEGTRPDGRQIANPRARSSLVKEGAKKVVDREVERQRLALNRYFKRVSSASETFHVHTYNPWDYPNT